MDKQPEVVILSSDSSENDSETTAGGSSRPVGKVEGLKPKDDQAGDDKMEGILKRLGIRSTGNYKNDSKLVLDKFLTEFGKQEPKHLDKIKKKFYAKFDQIKQCSEGVYLRLVEEMEQAIWLLQNTGKPWQAAQSLMNLIKAEARLDEQLKDKASLEQKTEEQVEEEREQKKAELRQKYEKQLQTIKQKIEELDEKEVDWDAEDDHNSTYILADKYKAKWMKSYYKLCELSDCHRLTGRPTHTRITLENYDAGSGYKAVDSAVETYINKKELLQPPDYNDIVGIVKEVNEDEGLGLLEEQVGSTAKQLFQKINRIIHNRRVKEYKVTMQSYFAPIRQSEAPSVPSANNALEQDDDQEALVKRYMDPAEEDAELKAKLEENDKFRKSEDEIYERFCKIAEEKGKAGEAVVEDEEDEEDEEDNSENLGNLDDELTDEDEDNTKGSVQDGGKRNLEEDFKKEDETDKQAAKKMRGED